MSVVKMLEVTVVGRVQDADRIVSALQAAGVLHPVPLAPPDAAGLKQAQRRGAVARSEELEATRRAISAYPPAARQDRVEDPGLSGVVARVKALREELQRLQDELAGVRAWQAEIEPWGDIEPGALDELAAAGVPVLCCVLTEAVWEALDLQRPLRERRLAWRVVERRGEELHVLLFGPAVAELRLTGVRLPPESAASLRARAEQLVAAISAAQRELGRHADALPAIDAAIEALADRVDVLRCVDGTFIDGPVFAMRGYVPAARQHVLQTSLSGLTAALRFAEPRPGAGVPVLLKNNPLVQGFEAIVRAFSGISYWEKDYTFAVGLLFVLFGSLCLLDGGYGVLLAISGLVLRKKGQEAFGKVFLATGVVATFVGILGGQYFGLVIGRDILHGVKPPTPIAADAFVCFVFSLIVGVVCMAFSYGMAIWQRGFRTVATGSLLMVIALVQIAVSRSNPEWLFAPFVHGDTAAELASTAAFIGERVSVVFALAAVAAWVVWPDPVFGEGKRAANVPWTLYSGITGLAQDIMSHMRLFGIALSGSIMAMVVNQVGAQLHPVATFLFAVVGHSAVFVLSMLSLYIHTNRLIFLEFGSKAFGGGQLWYEPLRRRASTT